MMRIVGLALAVYGAALVLFSSHKPSRMLGSAVLTIGALYASGLPR